MKINTRKLTMVKFGSLYRFIDEERNFCTVIEPDEINAVVLDDGRAYYFCNE